MAIAYVQGDNENPGTKTSWTHTFGSNITAGNFLVVAVSWGNTGVTVSSVADDQGNTWNSLTLRTVTGNRSQIFYAENVAGGSTTITVTLSGSSTGAGGVAHEYSGVATSSSFDVENFASGTGSGTDAATVSLTTAVDNSLIFAFAGCLGLVAVTPGTGFTGRTAATVAATNVGIGEDDLTNSAGSNTATATIASSVTWVINAAVFKPPSTAIEGDLDKTLGTLTVSGAGVLPIDSALAETLGTMTLDGEASLSGNEITGALSETLGTLASTGVGALAIDADLAKTLGTLTVSGAGNLPLVGSLSKTLGTLTSTGAGQLSLVGALSKTLGTLTSTGVGTKEIWGTSETTLGTLAVDGAGALAIDANLSETLGTLTSDATGQKEIYGTLAETLGTLTLSGYGSNASLGALSSTLGTLTLSGASKLAISGTAAKTLGTLTSTGAAQIALAGTTSTTLDAVTLTGVGINGTVNIVRGVPKKTLRITTATATPNSQTLITLDEGAAGQLTTEIIAREPATEDIKGWSLWTGITRADGGSAALVGSTTQLLTPQTNDAGNTSSWDADVDASGNNIRVTVTGEDSKTIEWYVVSSGMYFVP